jgi:hypothetical protein
LPAFLILSNFIFSFSLYHFSSCSLYFFSPRYAFFIFSRFSSYTLHAFDILTGPVIMHSGSKTYVIPFSTLRPFSCLVKILYDITECLIIYVLSFAMLCGSLYHYGRTHGCGLIIPSAFNCRSNLTSSEMERLSWSVNKRSGPFPKHSPNIRWRDWRIPRTPSAGHFVACSRRQLGAS